MVDQTKLGKKQKKVKHEALIVLNNRVTEVFIVFFVTLFLYLPLCFFLFFDWFWFVHIVVLIFIIVFKKVIVMFFATIGLYYIILFIFKRQHDRNTYLKQSKRSFLHE